MAEIGTDLQTAIALLEKGELVAIPTETVYGLAGNALSSAAVAKIFDVKQRPTFDPLIVHVPDLAAAERYVREIPEPAKKLAEQFWPGPLTLLLKKRSIIPDLVTAGLDTAGIRCPNHAITRSLLASLSFPLAAPSANPFGYVSPTQAGHVNEQLGGRIPYILDGGSCSVGIESTIVGFENSEPVVYRLGGITIAQIEQVVGPVRVTVNSSSNPKAPGQLKSHYAPRKKVIHSRLSDVIGQLTPAETGIITLGIVNLARPFAHHIVLSPSGTLDEAAQNIFAALRQMDKIDVVKVIVAEPMPNEGLGIAINDRLNRAAAQS